MAYCFFLCAGLRFINRSLVFNLSKAAFIWITIIFMAAGFCLIVFFVLVLASILLTPLEFPFWFIVFLLGCTLLFSKFWSCLALVNCFAVCFGRLCLLVQLAASFQSCAGAITPHVESGLMWSAKYFLPAA